MKPTDNRSAAEFFAELLLPLRYANIRRGIVYLDRGPKRISYWGGVVSRTGGMERLTGSGCHAASLLDSLGSYWARRGEPSLPQLLPNLERLRRELAAATSAEDPTTPQLPDFFYPLF